MKGFNIANGTLKSEKVQSIHTDLTCDMEKNVFLYVICLVPSCGGGYWFNFKRFWVRFPLVNDKFPWS